ncbi:MAG: tetratricopeptide repeat protein [Acidobacteriaceae bacterium]|nr:tetratricopeptide repeat protein [Acidobacteriaceae bacterium]MBV9779360.1 tetratricopeptide repeat protein [Acidobacteriaceae bacterium]
MEAHIKEHPAWFHRFDASWTPTVLILHSNGTERYRIEGYLPKEEFRAQLELGLARVVFKEKKWSDAERDYNAIVQNHPESDAAPEAMYWAAVSHYKGTNDHTILGKVAQQLEQKYPDSIWTKKALPWSGH